MLVEKPEAVVLCVALLVTCTAAQLGLNEEPRLRKRPRHFLHLRIQRTRDDLEHHVDCNVVCQDNSRDPVCGTNGQTFDSICDLDRDICRKVKVSLKHRGECSLAEKCLDERRAKQEQLANGESVYVPTCLADGSYAAVQCHNFTSYCWCSRLDGKPIPQTIQKERSPQCVEDRTSPPAPESPPQERCSGRTRKTFIDNMSHHLVKEFKRERNAKRMSEEKLLRKAVKWKFNRLDTDDDKQLKRREYRGFKKPVRKFIKPKKCAKKFPRLCDTDNNSILSEAEWMVCFLPTRKRGDQRPKPSCNRDRQSILEAESAGNNSIPIPVCQPNGKYERVQCYRDICLCVDEWTGNSLDGTGVTNGTPDCSRPMPHAREWPGCTGETKTKFILDLKKFLFNKVEGGDRSTGADSTTQSVEEFAATYHFRNLDRNNNQFLEKKEKRLAKRFLKSNPKLKKCGRKITNYCDVDRDNKVSLEEWIACVVVVQNETEDPPRPPPQGSSNPFETILKSEA